MSNKRPAFVPSSRGKEEISPYQVQQYPPPTNRSYGPYHEEHNTGGQDSNQVVDFSDFTIDGDYELPANTFDPASCAVLKNSTDVKRSDSQPPLPYFPPSNDEMFRSGIENQPRVTPLYNIPQAAKLGGESALMQGAQIHARNTPQPAQHTASKYGPYAGHFMSTESASKHRKQVTRFNRKPYRPPDTDYTIAEVEQNRLHHVERIYNAMTSGNAARDNKGSIAMKRWVNGAYYKPDLVEAYAHKVLDCLLQQVKYGFRGWVHNDYVADDRKGEDEDRNVSCEERLQSILRALEEEKTICEDVMTSGCQIRMFVNAPKAYANRKFQNRVGNSKRGKPKSFDTGEPSSKMPRLSTRPVTRSRRTGSSVFTPSDPVARVQEQSPGMSPRPRSQSHLSTPAVFAGSSDTIGPPGITPMPTRSYNHHPIFSHTVYPSQAPRVSTMPPQQYQPLMTSPPPPTLSYGPQSAPVSPEGNLILNPDVDSWSLFDNPWDVSNTQHDHVLTGPTANLFAMYPEAAENISGSIQPSGGDISNISFPEFWESQHEVQQFPYLQASDRGGTSDGCRPR